MCGVELGFVGNAALSQRRYRQAAVWVAGARQRAGDAGQIKVQGAFVLRVDQIVGPEAAGLGIGFHQRHLGVLAPGQAQIVQRVVVDEKQRGGGTVFRRHIGNRGAVADGQCRCAFATELQIRPHHLLLTQEFGQRQHHVGGGDALTRFAGQLHRHDIGQAHHRRPSQHHALGFQPTHTHGNDTQCIHMRRVAVGAHAGVGEGHALVGVNHRRHLFQIDLMHDAVACRNHIDVVKRTFAPVDEIEAVGIAAVFNGAVFCKCLWVEAWCLHRQRVIHDQLHRYHRVHLCRVATLGGDGLAQTGQVHQCGLAENVVAYHACRVPRKIHVAAALNQLHQIIIDVHWLGLAHDVFGMHARGVRQLGPRPRLQRFHRITRIEVV